MTTHLTDAETDLILELIEDKLDDIDNGPEGLEEVCKGDIKLMKKLQNKLRV